MNIKDLAVIAVVWFTANVVISLVRECILLSRARRANRMLDQSMRRRRVAV